jgi:hypothetical protein
MQAGFRAIGYGLEGAVAVGVGASILWSASALHLGRNYERLRSLGLARRPATDAVAKEIV